MSKRKDIIEQIKEKLFKKRKASDKTKLLKPTLWSLFGLGVRFKYCDESLINKVTALTI